MACLAWLEPQTARTWKNGKIDNMVGLVDILNEYTQGRLAARRSDTTPHRPRTAGGASPPAVHGRCSFVFFFYFFFHLTCSSYILVVLLLLQRLLPSYLFFFFFYFFFFFFFFLLVFLLLLPSFFFFFFFVGVSLPI